MDDITDQNATPSDQTRERAGEVAGTAKEQAAGVASAATEQVRAVTHEAQDQFRQLASSARDDLRTQADERAHDVATTLRKMADELRTMSGSIGHDSTLATLSREASDQVGSLANRLEQGGIERVSRDLAARARQRPGMFLLCSMAAGVVVGRLTRDLAPIANGSSNETTGTPGRLPTASTPPPRAQVPSQPSTTQPSTSQSSTARPTPSPGSTSSGSTPPVGQPDPAYTTGRGNVR